ILRISFFFFFSSRRRHTRSKRDWSSDVCSSDLMPLSRENGTLIVATGNPFDVYSLDELQTLTGLQVRPVLASSKEITRLIKTHFGVGGETVTAMVREREGDGVELLQDTETDDSELAKMAQEASVVKLVNEVLV